MIPIRDTVLALRTAWVVRVLLAINVAAFYLELRQGTAIQGFIYDWGVVSSSWALSQFSDLLKWPQLLMTLLSSQFLHGGLFHLASNMLYLWIFGDNVEDRLGHARFLLLYLGSGVAAAAVHILVDPTSSIPMVGASGAVAGILGAYLLLFPAARVVTLVPLGMTLKAIEIPAFFFLGIWFLLQWIQGVMSIGAVTEVGGVVFWAHIGGFIAGMIGLVLLRATSPPYEKA